MPKLILSAEAKRDLKDIRDYIADERESPKAALKVIEKILDRIERLINFPDSGTLLSPKVKFLTNYRFTGAAAHLIFYRHENNKIFIDRIIHSKRNYLAILFPESDDTSFP